MYVTRIFILFILVLSSRKAFERFNINQIPYQKLSSLCVCDRGHRSVDLALKIVSERGGKKEEL